MTDRVRSTLIYAVLVVWGANMLAPIFVHDFQPPEGVHVAFMAIVGVLTAGYGSGRERQGNGQHSQAGPGT